MNPSVLIKFEFSNSVRRLAPKFVSFPKMFKLKFTYVFILYLKFKVAVTYLVERWRLWVSDF